MLMSEPQVAASQNSNTPYPCLPCESGVWSGKWRKEQMLQLSGQWQLASGATSGDKAGLSPKLLRCPSIAPQWPKLLSLFLLHLHVPTAIGKKMRLIRQSATQVRSWPGNSSRCAFIDPGLEGALIAEKPIPSASNCGSSYAGAHILDPAVPSQYVILHTMLPSQQSSIDSQRGSDIGMIQIARNTG
ncbi:hypothetical protein CI238_10459 [Colletotrichum incanum]|uniref:Uncharacterized protein n=1 Tax=Colletotrichum incanum TaxID=1573173 RepID=A0A167AW35_COLIC|nr:hypothetical protein CI238_10459 [Colletotrichum incanum]